jgi:Cu/Ag efflux protein CusF
VKTTSALLSLVLLGAVGAGGYWFGTRATHGALPSAAGPAPTATAAAAASATVAAPARKLLYYRNPMGLPDISQVPKKDSMGMDYVPVYEGEDTAAAAGDPGAAGRVTLSTEKIQKLGVRTEAAAMHVLGQTVRAAGRVEPDERRISAVTARFDGYVERLHVNATGQAVARGQPLFEAYSPDLVAAQREYAIAVQGQQALKDSGPDAQAGMRQLADSALVRLRNWGLSPDQVAALAASGDVKRSIVFPSPASGIVTEKKALQGMRFMAGEMLYQVTDLSSVWVIADLAEQDIAAVRSGARARITTTAYPREVFEGRVTYIYPTMKADTMFAQVELATGNATPVLTVPDSALIDTGTRRIVLVRLDEGRFEPREVEVGRRGDNRIEILKGLREGEPVVVAANFLIDAESNLKAAIGTLTAPAGSASAATGAASAAAGTSMPAAQKPTGVSHQADGRVDSIDMKAGTLSLEHGPVASLKWPAMTMEFKLAHAGLAQGLRAGQAVHFEFVERQPGDYVVTAIQPAAGQASPVTPAAKPAPAASGHSGH